MLRLVSESEEKRRAREVAGYQAWREATWRDANARALALASGVAITICDDPPLREPYNPEFFGQDALDSYIADQWVQDHLSQWGLKMDLLSQQERDELRVETFIKVLFVRHVAKNPMPALSAQRQDYQEQLWVRHRQLPTELAFGVNLVVHARGDAGQAALIEDIHRYRDTHALETVLDT